MVNRCDFIFKGETCECVLHVGDLLLTPLSGACHCGV